MHPLIHAKCVHPVREEAQTTKCHKQNRKKQRRTLSKGETNYHTLYMACCGVARTQVIRLKSMEASSKAALRAENEAQVIKKLLEPSPFLLEQVKRMTDNTRFFYQVSYLLHFTSLYCAIIQRTRTERFVLLLKAQRHCYLGFMRY